MRELRRKFYDDLVNWKRTHHQECLLVKGARQIGKTYIIEKFGRENYESLLTFNFILEPDAAELFEGSLKAEDLYKKISAYDATDAAETDNTTPWTSAYDATKQLMPGRTLIFLDEIQECANARTALKSFALDGRYDVIASGSLLGVKYRNKRSRAKHEPKSIPVGYERSVMMQ